MFLNTLISLTCGSALITCGSALLTCAALFLAPSDSLKAPLTFIFTFLNEAGPDDSMWRVDTVVDHRVDPLRYRVDHLLSR